ncbi:hypothetical protein Lalb_Chr06g0172361 [Lupinus albus]|uniref:Uncharacterized protein n=1 Tax=Lupinus albus TaxID=3870 RepID=A0A6A4QEL0_LUPAL|nr:hypothetical protein Lalb_Chr06g0172361 [Lupinus albus]
MKLPYVTLIPPSTSRKSLPSIHCAVRFRPCIDIHKACHPFSFSLFFSFS